MGGAAVRLSLTRRKSNFATRPIHQSALSTRTFAINAIDVPVQVPRHVTGFRPLPEEAAREENTLVGASCAESVAAGLGSCSLQGR